MLAMYPSFLKKEVVMKTKKILRIISFVLVVAFTLSSVGVSHAGFIKDDPSLGGAAQFAEDAGRNLKVTSTGTYVYPLSRDGRFIVYPGPAWAVQFYLPLNTCFKVKDGEHKYVTNTGEPCDP